MGAGCLACLNRKGQLLSTFNTSLEGVCKASFGDFKQSLRPIFVWFRVKYKPGFKQAKQPAPIIV